MIDAISIFTKGGVVLWSYYFIRLKDCPFNELVQTVLLEERTSTGPFEFGFSRLAWRYDNESDLVCVVAYPGLQPICYVDALLQLTQKNFAAHLDKHGISLSKENKDFATLPTCVGSSDVGSGYGGIPSFDKKFLIILTKCDEMLSKTDQSDKGAKSKTLQRQDDEELDLDGVEDLAGEEVPQNEQEAKQRLLCKEKTTAKSVVEGKKHKKKDANWASQKVTRRAMDALDFSKRIDQSNPDEVHEVLTKYDAPEESDDEDVLLDKEEDKDESTGLFARVSSAIKGVTGNKELTASELDLVLGEFRSSLMAKNVAVEIADLVTESVKASLVGHKTERFTTVQQTVKDAMISAVERIMTPKSSVDLLRAALEAKAKGRVYSIVFLGVNGVGKSTNLAKVCYYLKHKGGLKVMMAACDTFRAGAVEQLRTHARCRPNSQRGLGLRKRSSL
eukprot:GHVS01071365.1.p1 GENE.GHVS01071365.1~~GHVS01071365.1.p1  ORF type:complete len:447 (+),score=69.88 GHVS01071365.1:72-1412(+)